MHTYTTSCPNTNRLLIADVEIPRLAEKSGNRNELYPAARMAGSMMKKIMGRVVLLVMSFTMASWRESTLRGSCSKGVLVCGRMRHTTTSSIAPTTATNTYTHALPNACATKPPSTVPKAAAEVSVRFTPCAASARTSSVSARRGKE